MKSISYYKLLNIDKNFTSQELKKAYFKKAKQYHPDVNKSKNAEELFKLVNLAYETLKDPKLRRDYDYKLNSQTKSKYSNTNRNETQTYTNSSYEDDGAYIFQLFRAPHLNQEEINIFIKNNFKTEQNSTRAFENFWIAFWSGGVNTWDGLKNKTVSKIFLAFTKNSYIDLIAKNALKEINVNLKLKNEFQIFKSTLLSTIDYFRNNLDDYNLCFRKMKNLIQQKNGFDLPEYFPWFLIVRQNSYTLLWFFEQIYEAKFKAIKDGVETNKKTPRKKKNTASVLIIAVIVVFALSFYFFRGN